VAAVARPVTFPDGFEVVTEGDDGLGFFVVRSGEVEVVRGGMRLATLGPDSWFGEMALLDNLPRSASVRATAPTDALAFYRWDFLPEVRRHPQIAIALMAELSRRIRELDASLAER
jgi:CRP/FNR family transcriptional regulator